MYVAFALAGFSVLLAGLERLRWSVLALVALGCYQFLSRTTSTKLGKDTVELLTTHPEVEPKCRAIVKALLDAPLQDDVTECAATMRAIVAAKHLPYTELRDDPQVLLNVNRHITSCNGALGTRFTVQFNLFAGTIVALGSDEQREQLFAAQHKGELGCFAFTEMGAGVLSGAQVETIATFDEGTDSFLISSPSESSKKYWISQGLVAEHAVILARVVIGGEDKGPHLFWHRIATRSGDVITHSRGVEVSSLGDKTTLQGLDNAFITFRDFRVPRSSLLSRFVAISAAGEHTFNLPPGVTRMLDLLLSRLLTGRICLSDYAIGYAAHAARSSFAYATTRKLWKGRKAEQPLMANMPLIAGNFRRYGQSLAVVAHFIGTTRAQVAQCIRNDVFTHRVVEAACICKFVGTSFGVDAVSAVRKMMTARGLLDPLLGTASFACNAACAAEGDNTIMELKVVGDMVRGRTKMLPLGLLLSSLFHGHSRTSAWVYLKGMARAMWLRKAAMKEGQLLRDIAWARALMLIMATWRKAGKPKAWLTSVDEVLGRFPVPQCH